VFPFIGPPKLAPFAQAGNPSPSQESKIKTDCGLDALRSKFALVLLFLCPFVPFVVLSSFGIYAAFSQFTIHGTPQREEHHKEHKWNEEKQARNFRRSGDLRPIPAQAEIHLASFVPFRALRGVSISSAA
jgi:hypothetical protein